MELDDGFIAVFERMRQLVTPRIATSVLSNQKFPLFKLPTSFSASFTDGTSMCKALKFYVFVTWKGGQLGLTVARDGVRECTAFERMFD